MVSIQFKILLLMTAQHLVPEIIQHTSLQKFLGAHLRIWHYIKHGKGPKLQFWCCNLTWCFYPVISLGVSFPLISYPFSLKSNFWEFGGFGWGLVDAHSCIVLICAVNLVCSTVLEFIVQGLDSKWGPENLSQTNSLSVGDDCVII